jgi:hypothetical protein
MSKEEPSVSTPEPPGPGDEPTEAAELNLVLEPIVIRAKAEVARRRRGEASLKEPSVSALEPGPDEEPTEAAEAFIVLKPVVVRAKAEVARTRRWGVGSLVTTAALTICVILITSLTSLGSQKPLVVLISAAITAAFGSSLGFFLSLPGKSDRYRRLTGQLDATRGRAGTVRGSRDETSGSS